MPIPKIISFVEGQGDTEAVPILIRRVLQDQTGSKLNSSLVNVDPNAWRVGHLQKLLAENGKAWIRFLDTAQRRGGTGVLLLLDGDRLQGRCPGEAAQPLTILAKKHCGAGERFSVAVVFAMQEIESWFLADAEDLIGSKTSPMSRQRSMIDFPSGNLERSPRDAKRWFSYNMPDGYKPTIHQADFANKLNIQKVRSCKLRSFRRFERAVEVLFKAVISGQHEATP